MRAGLPIVPRDFQYLLAVGEKYGIHHGVVDQVTSQLRKLTVDDLAVLAECYREVEKREDSYAISRWLDKCPPEAWKHGPANNILGLLYLFTRLGEAGICPFTSQAVGYKAAGTEKFDWSRLPQRLHYLIEVAEKCHGKEGDVVEGDDVDEEEIALLEETAQRIRTSKDHLVIEQWFDQFPIDEYPESWAVYTVLLALDSLGLEVE